MGRSIPTGELDCDDRMKNLLEKLDQAFQTKTAELTFDYYVELENLIRVEHEPFNAYIVKFERIYDKAAKYGLVLPDAGKASTLLKSARLGDSEWQLVLSNCKKVEYKDIKASFNLIFGTTLGKPSQSISISIKEDSSLVAHFYQETRERGSGLRGRGNFIR